MPPATVNLESRVLEDFLSLFDVVAFQRTTTGMLTPMDWAASTTPLANDIAFDDAAEYVDEDSPSHSGLQKDF